MRYDVQELPNDSGRLTILDQLAPLAQHHEVCILVAQACWLVHCAESQWCEQVSKCPKLEM